MLTPQLKISDFIPIHIYKCLCIKSLCYYATFFYTYVHGDLCLQTLKDTNVMNVWLIYHMLKYMLKYETLSCSTLLIKRNWIWIKKEFMWNQTESNSIPFIFNFKFNKLKILHSTNAFPSYSN